jgi:hypothetical protein
VVGRNLAGPPLAARPWATLQRADSFQGPPRKSKTSIVFAVFLIIVNCVENDIKIRKMQNQFCCIGNELSNNFCYSCLS